MSREAAGIRYYVTIRGREFEVEIQDRQHPPGVRLDGHSVSAELTLLREPALYALFLNGHSRELFLERDGDRIAVFLEGERLEARVQDEVSRALSAFGGAESAGASEVVAPMPGVVVEIPVHPGDAVQVGQPVIVVEAMKMQNELLAETQGVVEEVRVEAGQAVEGGTVLVVIRAPEEP